MITAFSSTIRSIDGDKTMVLMANPTLPCSSQTTAHALPGVQ